LHFNYFREFTSNILDATIDLQRRAGVSTRGASPLGLKQTLAKCVLYSQLYVIHDDRPRRRRRGQGPALRRKCSAPSLACWYAAMERPTNARAAGAHRTPAGHAARAVATQFHALRSPNTAEATRHSFGASETAQRQTCSEVNLFGPQLATSS